MNRRRFLEQCGLAASAFGAPAVWTAALEAMPIHMASAREIRADVAIVGGGLGGCAAALAAARDGATVVLSEPTDWIGGQLTSQAVPPDEHPWIESFGCTRAYRQLRTRIRDYYRRHYPLTHEARASAYLNPGRGKVSKLCHEPRVALAALQSLIAPYLGSGRVMLLLNHVAVEAETAGDRVQSVHLRDQRSGDLRVLSADWFLDASEEGDLLPLTKTEYVTGFESRQQTGEPHAPDEAQPKNIQSWTWCFAVDHLAGENHTIDKPQDYSFWRSYVPDLKPPWPGKLLSWSMSNPRDHKPRSVMFDPSGGEVAGTLNLWLYRRIADRASFASGTYPSDVTLVNWPQNDYWLGNLHEVDQPERDRHLREARQLSLSLLYWLQTEAPRADGGEGWPGLRLRGDLMGTTDGLAMAPYIRESRRILAEQTITEQLVGTQARSEKTGLPRKKVSAASFQDTVGIGSYRIDLHPTTAGDNYLDISSLPFEIPLGSLIPRRLENLLPACKNLGTTHITNGCYRLHPVEWNIGEAAGALVAYCGNHGEMPRRVRNHKPRLAAFQNQLRRHGVELRWPRVTPR